MIAVVSTGQIEIHDINYIKSNIYVDIHWVNMSNQLISGHQCAPQWVQQRQVISR